jgi:outer membrane usher protein
VFPASRNRLSACILAVLGATQGIGGAIADPAVPLIGYDLGAVEDGGGDPSAPAIGYDLASIGDDRRPAGGNVTSTPTAAPAEDAGFDPAGDEGAMTVLGVAINGHEMRGDTIVTVRDGRALVPVDDLKRWRLPFSGAPIRIDDQAFAPLYSIRGLTYRIDRESQQLQIHVPVSSFESSEISGGPALLPPSEAARTAFLNYDLSMQHASGSTVGGAFFEMGASGRLGLVENSFTIGNNPGGRDLVRLDTFAVHDDLSGLTRLTIGDTFTHQATWEQPVRFGGIKWGTDFSLQPGFLSFPTPTFGGQAQLPSSVQLYVNNVLNYQGQVEQGPFTLNRLPVVSGAGDVSVVVKDALGVEHRVVSNYYVSTNLLRPGLSDFSFEAGAERHNYGRLSFDYGPPFVAGSFRHGLTSGLTVEARGEASSRTQDVGGGIAAVIGKVGEVGLSGSASTTRDGGSGYLYRVFASRVSQHWSLAASYEYASPDYLQLGLDHDLERPRETLQISGGFNGRDFGSLSANISYLRLSDGTRTRVSSLTYGRQLGKLGYLNAFALRSDTDDGSPDTTIGVSLSVAFGSRGTAFAQVDNRNRRLESQLNLPDDKGWGYRLVASDGQNSQQQAELDYRGRVIDLSGAVERFNGATDQRFLASGSLILSGSSVLPARRLDSSFAIVNVGDGEKGVRVYQENRLVGSTNGAGIAVVTNLRPYEANRISVAPDDLKLESMIANDNLVVVPRYLSGVKANFRVTNGLAGTVVVRLPSGDPLEPGTAVAIGAAIFYTGFDGELFVDDIKPGAVMVAKRAAGDCSVTLPALPKGVELPRVGPLTCMPVNPSQ